MPHRLRAVHAVIVLTQTLKMKTTVKLESQEKVKYIGLLGLNWIALSFYSVSHHLHSETQ